MFRYSISHGKESVTLGEEIHHVRNYMSVQKYRYGDKIGFEYLVDDELLHYRTIKLICSRSSKTRSSMGWKSSAARAGFCSAPIRSGEHLYQHCG